MAYLATIFRIASDALAVSVIFGIVFDAIVTTVAVVAAGTY